MTLTAQEENFKRKSNKSRKSATFLYKRKNFLWCWWWKPYPKNASIFREPTWSCLRGGDALKKWPCMVISNQSRERLARGLAPTGVDVPQGTQNPDKIKFDIIKKMVLVVGVEPTWSCLRGILSPLRLPFRHTSIYHSRYFNIFLFLFQLILSFFFKKCLVNLILCTKV